MRVNEGPFESVSVGHLTDGLNTRPFGFALIKGSVPNFLLCY